MQTEAAPREPFTIGVLFRYKFTIFAVAVFVILGGYVRIITQPKLYEATSRLEVRFGQSAIALKGEQGSSFYRLPLLEEEVKAYTSQLRDRRIIEQVLDDLPTEAGGGQDAEDEDSPAKKFRAAFLSAYYSIRKAVFSAVDLVLFSSDVVVTDREQRVNQILSRMEVTAGEEASHLITVSYQNPNPAIAAQLVNTLSKKFIQLQRRKVKKKDELKAQKALDDSVRELYENRQKTQELANKLESPTLSAAILRRYAQIETIQQQKRRFEVAKELLDRGVIPYDKELPIESPSLQNELERIRLEYQIRYEQVIREAPEKRLVFEPLLTMPKEYIDRRRKEASENDKAVVAAEVLALDEQIKKLSDDTSLTTLGPQLTRLEVEQERIQKKIVQADADFNEVKAFNKELEDENVAENIAFHTPAIVPPFPLPQHREVKLLVVIALGLFAGCAAALLRHQVKPRPIRRVRPRSEAETNVPIVILPDDGRGRVEKDLEIDISFPSDDDAEAGVRGGSASRK